MIYSRALLTEFRLSDAAYRRNPGRAQQRAENWVLGPSRGDFVESWRKFDSRDEKQGRSDCTGSVTARYREQLIQHVLPFPWTVVIASNQLAGLSLMSWTVVALKPTSTVAWSAPVFPFDIVLA